MHKTYRVKLIAEERGYLEQLLMKGTAAARTLTHARILLKADEGAAGPGWTDAQIAEALEINRSTVERVRQRCVEEGGLRRGLAAPPVAAGAAAQAGWGGRSAAGGPGLQPHPSGTAALDDGVARRPARGHRGGREHLGRDRAAHAKKTRAAKLAG